MSVRGEPFLANIFTRSGFQQTLDGLGFGRVFVSEDSFLVVARFGIRSLELNFLSSQTVELFKSRRKLTEPGFNLLEALSVGIGLG